MTYNPNTPLASERISDTQQPIRDNFFLSNQYFGIDHFEFDAASNNGKHKQVTLPDRTATPPATIASECAIYARTASAQTFPYMRRDASATDIPVIPLKAFAECTVPGAVVTANSFNVSSVTRNGAGRYQFNFAVPMPDTNYAVLCTYSLSGTNPMPDISYNLPAKLTTSVEIQIIAGNGSGFTDSTVSVISMAVLRA